jgi:hypothetical protein
LAGGHSEYPPISLLWGRQEVKSWLIPLALSMAGRVHEAPAGKRRVRMERSLVELEKIVRDTICRVCSDRKEDGTCGLEVPGTCALFRMFPQVAQTIQSTHSDDIRDYVQAIRNQVCSVCIGQDADGSCETRENVACALNAYLLLVVDAIEEATGRKFELPASFAKASTVARLGNN